MRANASSCTFVTLTRQRWSFAGAYRSLRCALQLRSEARCQRGRDGNTSTGLREQDREVWLAGERVRDVTTHPGLANGARAIASLYDMQSDPKTRDEMTYVSPTTGDRVGLSFIIPRTARISKSAAS